MPGGFPKTETIPNAAQIRITRPGLDFVQENLGGIAQKAIGAAGAGGVITFDIPKANQTGAEICSVATPKPPECQAEIDLGNAKLRINAVTPNRVKIDGVLPVRIRDLPIKLIGFVNAFVVAGAPGQNLCSKRGNADFPYKEVPVNVELPLVTETRAPRDGYTKLDVDNAVIDIGITQNDVEICDATCGGLCQAAFDFVKSFAFNALIGGIKDQIKSALAGAFCTAPTPSVTPPCPTGSSPNDADPAKATKCVFTGTDQCVPSLLGTDGRMDLSKALASFSPGTKGGLDFLFASAGDMSPDPKAAGIPGWTPRKPPVPSADNNANGISLSMLGGALPQPKSNCVVPVDAPPPQNIAVPQELKGDKITPWPDGTPGPHLGVAVAGRFLDHAFTGAYNSGLLCLGVSTESVSQLNSGILSLLAPSVKNLTLEAQSAAAAITTRPGAPPKVKLGGGGDVNADPLLAISLEKFAVDFYVWSFDRFVRLFTYTADVTVPVNIQTGKDPKNPNGGLLPVIGDIKVANASVSNADNLLFEDAKVIGDGMTGLLGGIVGQFLGGGLNAIDLQSALQSVGLALEIPAGGIRKLTSGSDDFLGIFANLKTAAGTASEEADTRAVLVGKEIDRDAMALDTASRPRFPKLRVRIDTIASRPTEHTWWIDQGTHSTWTRDRELVVDSDAMLLQGKHVLHVSSRVVGDAVSEDVTPVEIPFVIDALAPQIHAEREGSHVSVSAWDLVSAPSSLVARHRVGAGAWTEFAPVADFDVSAPDAVELEVRDEEGNIGRVSLPLRGRADSTLGAGGSSCGCRATGQTTTGSVYAASLALAVLAAAIRRRSRGAGRLREGAEQR